MSATVDCPHCGHENDMTDALCEFSDNNFDWECEECSEKFEVYVEFDPTFSACEIVYVNCEKCGTETRDPAKKGNIYPWPQFIDHNILCRSCFRKAHQEEYDKRQCTSPKDI